MSMASMAWAYIRPREPFAGRIGQGLTDQTLKNIHAGWDDIPGVTHEMVEGGVAKWQSIEKFARLT